MSSLSGGKAVCEGKCFAAVPVSEAHDTTLLSGAAKQTRASSEAFVYDSINEWQTQLVLLHPSALENALEGDPLQADLTLLDGAVLTDERKRVDYLALSYHWGMMDASEPILLNGKTFLVTKDLHAAMLNLRSRDEPKYVWVDRLCINQQDALEKS